MDLRDTDLVNTAKIAEDLISFPFNPIEARRMAKMHKDKAIVARMCLELDSALKESQAYAVELERRCAFLRKGVDEYQRYTGLYGDQLIAMQYELDARNGQPPLLFVRKKTHDEMLMALPNSPSYVFCSAEELDSFPLYVKFNAENLVIPLKHSDADLTGDDGGGVIEIAVNPDGDVGDVTFASQAQERFRNE